MDAVEEHDMAVMASAGHAMEAAGSRRASHGSDLLSVPGDMLFTHMAPHVLGDVAALRTTCRMFRTNAAVAVAEAAQSAHLHLGEQVRGTRALGAALGSALSQCEQPKNLSVSITGRDWSPHTVLDGMRRSGAHQHVAALHLKHLDEQVLTVLAALARWPHLRSLKIDTYLFAEQAMGAKLAKLRGLQSLSLKLQPDWKKGGFSQSTLHASHLRQLTQLTSLSLGISGDSAAALALVGSVSAMPLLCKLDLRYGMASSNDELLAALPRLTALTSLSLNCSHAHGASSLGPALLRAISALPSLHHLGLPRPYTITQCATALSSLTGLRSLRLSGAMGEGQEPRAAQLLSRLTSLEVHRWVGSGGNQKHRASWLAQVKQVAVGQVELPVLAALPPDVCISTAASAPKRMVQISCRSDCSGGAVCEAVARLVNSRYVKDNSCVLYMAGLQAQHCAAIKPLAEAVAGVGRVTPQLLPHMAGWHLRCLKVNACSADLPQLVQAAVAVEGLQVSTLHVSFCTCLSTANTHATADTQQAAATAAAATAARAAALVSVRQLCQGLQGLKEVVARCRPHAPPAERQRVLEEQQQVVQALQQAVQGRGVEVKVVGLAGV